LPMQDYSISLTLRNCGVFVVSTKAEAYYVRARLQIETPPKSTGDAGLPGNAALTCAASAVVEHVKFPQVVLNYAERSDDCRFQSPLARRTGRARRSELRHGAQGVQRDDRPAATADCALRRRRRRHGGGDVRPRAQNAAVHPRRWAQRWRVGGMR